VARQRARFEKYLAQGNGAAKKGLSGDQLDGSGGEEVYLVIEERKRRRHSQTGRARRLKPRPPSDFERGAAVNRWDMWMVDRIMEVRRVARRTRGGDEARLQVKIRWVGTWRDSWSETHRRIYSKGKCRLQPMLNAASMAEARAMEVVKYGSRAPKKRSAAVVTYSGRKRRAKWSSALRSAARRTDEEEGTRVRRRVTKARYIREEEAAAASTTVGKRRRQEEAWADLRRQRAAGREKRGGRKRRWRELPESEEEMSDGEEAEEGEGEDAGGDQAKEGERPDARRPRVEGAEEDGARGSG